MKDKKTPARILLFLCLMMLFPCISFGENDLPVITGGQLGEEGVIVSGREYPLTVTIRNGNTPFQGLISADVYGTLPRFIRYETKVSLSPHETKQFTLQILPLTYQTEYEVQLWAENQMIDSLSLPVTLIQGDHPAQPGLPLSNASDLTPVENRSTALPMMICLAVYLLVGVAGGYFLLKKWGRREFAWGLIPALSLLCALTIYLLSLGQEYHTPAAVTLCIYDLDENQVYAGAQVSLPGNQEIALSSPGQDISRPDNTVFSFAWQNSSDIVPKLSARYHQGENQQVILPSDAPWQTTNLHISNLPMENVALTGSAQPDEKGISGYVKNESAHDFSVCAVFTPAGCTLLPPLKAGESMEFSLPWGEYFSKKTQYQEGFLSFPVSMSSYDIYYRLGSLIQEGDWVDIPYMHQQFSSYDQRYALSNLMRNLLEDYWNTANSPCLFIGLADTLGRFPLAADGKEITRRGHLSAVVSHLEYQAAGDDGTLLYLPGTISPTLASLAENIPQDLGTAAFGVQPTDNQLLLCYTFPGAGKTEAEWLMLWNNNYVTSQSVTYSIYDFNTAEWVKLDSESYVSLFQGEEIRAFLQEDKMYLRIQVPASLQYNTMLPLPRVSYLGREK